MMIQIKFFCTLQIHVKKDCELPIGLHPMIRVPKNNVKNKKLNQVIFNLA